MTERPESTSEPVEGQEQPTPAVPSPVSADKLSSAQPALSASDLANALRDPQVKKTLTDMLKPEWEKADQSVKDRRIRGLTDDIERLKAYVERAGDFDQGVRDMQVDDILAANRYGEVVGATSTEQQDVAFMEARSAQILQDAGIGFDDPDYRVMVSQYQGRVTPEQWIELVQGLASNRTRKVAKQQGVTQAAAIVPGGQAPTAAGDLDSLVAELDAIHKGQRGSLTNPKVQQRRKELRAQIAAQTDQRPDIR